MGDRYSDAHAERPTFTPDCAPRMSPSQDGFGVSPALPSIGTPAPGMQPSVGTPGVGTGPFIIPPESAGVSPQDQLWNSAYYDESARLRARQDFAAQFPPVEVPTHFLFVDSDDEFHCLPVATSGVANTEAGLCVVSRMGSKVIGIQIKKGTKIRAVGPREVAEAFNRAG